MSLSELPGLDPKQVGQEFAGLPMPRKLDILTDRTRRPLEMSGHKRFPFPVPNGWFIVARADELQPGEVMPLYLFGRHLVLFRTESGEPRLMDAHCPHLGAHLGVGGRVRGDTIQCPFHGWRFRGEDGTCVEVPYDDVDFIPRKAHARAYPTIERNQMIWAWHHLEGGEPFYDVPEVPEIDDPEWSDIVVREFPVATCCQEMSENNVDTVHFKYVHGSEAVPEEEFVIEGPYKRSVGWGGNFIREGFGLGLGVLRMKNWVTFISSTTPIDEENVLVRWIFTSPRSLAEGEAEKAANVFTEAVTQDIPIWENKIYKDPPVLRPMEKAVTEQRRWCRQFYSYVDETHPGLVDP
jgi:nitrite reductase/ring-hydroxylating ferredoxin subunit